MRTIETSFETFGASVLLLGYKKDNLASKIVIDCADALEEYQGATATLSIVDPEGTVYPGNVTIEAGVVTWLVKARDTAYPGHGSARLDLVDNGGTVVASCEGVTLILNTHMSGVAPDAIEDWVDEASEALTEVRALLLDLNEDIEDVAVAEAARVLAEQGRVSAEELRVIAENARVSAEQGRVTAEQGRVTAEQGRVTAEQGRVTAEQGRVTAEQGRVTAEQGRVTAEQGRVTAEANREAYEALRSTNESSRVNEETHRRYEEMDRADAEQQRLMAEASRERNESARVTAEQGRVTAEQGRVTAEQGRASAEQGRVTAEAARETAEDEREEGYSTIEQNAQAALSYIGPSESTSTASAAHAQGSYLIYDGKLYQATADIAIGDTLATTGTGANIAQAPGGAMGEVADLKSAIANVQTAFNVNENGGVLNVPFKNGYYTKVESTPVPYHIMLTNSSTYCSIPPAFPITVSAGDVLTIDSAYTVSALNKVTKDSVGTLVTEAYSTQLTEINTNHVYTFLVGGLYVMCIRKSVDGAYVAFTPDELTGKITLTASPAAKAISDEVTYTDNRLVASVMGEYYYADFVQGSIERIATGSSYLKHSASTSICSTALDKPLVIFKGDTIDVDSEYKIAVCNKVEIDSTGVKLIGQISDIVGASHYTFKESGLYLLLVRKPKPNASTYLDFGYMELQGKIAITARGLNNVISTDPQKPLNPYANLYWGTEYITSCHAHCLNTIAGLIQAGYTAIIPTNYRPPKPYYPLKAFYPNVEGVEDYLAAPNTEIGANVATNKPAHFCNPGSFFACGTDSSATYTGTLDEMMNDCRNARKGWFLGGVIINHPSWSNLTAADMIPALQKYSDILGIEFYNYGCEVSDQNGWALTQWDAILASGVQCFGFAGPDHALETSATDNTPYGFLHVLPACPTDDALLAAIGSGRFYASLYNDGLKFTRIGKTGSKISVTATAPTSNNPTIKFVTAQGESTVNGLTGEYTFSQSDIYVRVEVSNGNNVLYSNAIML